jgi:ER lumen protein retaining receptor
VCRYNTIMKILFIYVTVSVVYLIRYKRSIRVTYDKDRDTFRSELLVALSTVCALFVHEHIKGAGYIHFFMEVCSSKTAALSPCR